MWDVELSQSGLGSYDCAEAAGGSPRESRKCGTGANSARGSRSRRTRRIGKRWDGYAKSLV